MGSNRSFNAAVLAVAAVGMLTVATPAEAGGGGALRLRARGGISPPPPPPPPPPASAIAAGTGWTGVTPGDGDHVGNPADYGYDEYPVAVWDEVQNNTISTNKKIGIVARHAPTPAQYVAGTKSNIQKVEFSCQNGPWVSVTATSVNSDNDSVDEYWAPLAISTFTDAVDQECRAIITPTVGKIRVLQGAMSNLDTRQSFYFNANANGTLPAATRHVAAAGTDSGSCGTTTGNACATVRQARNNCTSTLGSLKVGGCTILVGAGTTYTYGGTSENSIYNALSQYMTIQPEPGLTAADVVFTISNASGLRTQKVHLKDVTFNAPTTAGGTRTGINVGNTKNSPDPTTLYAAVWADGVVFVGSGWQFGSVNPIESSGSTGRKFWTRGSVTNSTRGFLSYNLVRAATVTTVGSDVFSDTLVLLDSSVSDIRTYYQDNYPTGTITTAVATSGSATLTGVTSFNGIAVGGAISPLCIFPGTRTIAAFDSGLGTITLSSAVPTYTGSGGALCQVGGTTTQLWTGDHSDIYARNNGVRYNMAIKGLNAYQYVTSQCIFSNGTAPQSYDFLVEGFVCNNQPFAQANNAVQWSQTAQNFIFKDNTWQAGIFNFRTNSITDWAMIDQTWILACPISSGGVPNPPTGVTYFPAGQCP